MKDFSNETKSKRRKAVFKVILKRYSFIIWLPLLLYVSYNVGKFTMNYPDIKSSTTSIIAIIAIIFDILLGFMVLFILLVILLSMLLFIDFIIEKVYDIIIIPLKEKRFFNDLINFIKSIGKLLLEVLSFVLLEKLPQILKGILKCPINLYKRIKDEKRRFQVAVEKQMKKET